MPLGWNTLAYAHPALSVFAVVFDKNIDSIYYEGFSVEKSLSCITSTDGKSYCPNCVAKFKPFDAALLFYMIIFKVQNLKFNF